LQVPATDGLAEWLEDRAVHAPSEYTYMQVAEIDGEAVGHIWAAIRPPDVDAARHMLRDGVIPRLTVHWLGVADGYRRQGIRTRLLQAA
jgi:GNAT superfamily N-acetyltransferase